MENKNHDELMKAIADVIDEAVTEYDALVKNQGIDYAQAMPDHKGDGGKAKNVDGSLGEGTGAADNSGAGAMKKEDEEEKDKDEDEDKEMDDEKLMQTYKSLVAKMEKRGMMNKMKKSETTTEVAPQPAVDTKEIESLKKSTDERFETLNKALQSISESVKKIASQPVRKGVAGYQPLKKTDSDEAPALKKSEVVEKLLDLKKSGDKRVNELGPTFSTLINRIETNRLQKSDADTIKRILG